MAVRMRQTQQQREAQCFMTQQVEPLVTALVQNLYLSKTIDSPVDVPAAMLSFLRRRAGAGLGRSAIVPPSPARLERLLPGFLPTRSRPTSDAARRAMRDSVMRELKPILCEVCKLACAARPLNLEVFFVQHLESRPVFLSPLYHLERFGSCGSFEPPRRSLEELEPQRSARLFQPLPSPRPDLEAHRIKVQRLALPSWWLPSGAWRLVWADDFDYVGLPDPRRWAFQTNCNKWIHDQKHGELQHYTADRKQNAWVEGGVLRVTAVREPWENCSYTSARLHTKNRGDWLYGRIEVCAKLPACRRGLWPALWLLPTDSVYGRWPRSGEIDLCENIGWHAPGTIHTSVHTAAANHSNRSHSHLATVVPDAHAAFHVYSLVWRPKQLLICVDGDVIHSFDKPPKKEGQADWERWPFDQRFFLLINLAVGGKWAGKEGIDESAFPASLEIAYVRIWEERGQ